MDDREKATEIINEIRRADDGIGTQFVVKLVGSLMVGYGEQFTLGGAIDALEKLKDAADLMQIELNKAQP